MPKFTVYEGYTEHSLEAAKYRHGPEFIDFYDEQGRVIASFKGASISRIEKDGVVTTKDEGPTVA